MRLEESLESRVLRLRYGSSDPGYRPKPLFSVPVLSKYLRIPPARVTSILEKYFRRVKKAQANANVVDVPDYLAAPETLEAQFLLSLRERVATHNRAHPLGPPLTLRQLRDLYRARGIKKKKLLCHAHNPRRHS